MLLFPPNVSDDNRSSLSESFSAPIDVGTLFGVEIVRDPSSLFIEFQGVADSDVSIFAFFHNCLITFNKRYVVFY